MTVFIPYEGSGPHWEMQFGSMQVSFGFKPADPQAGERAQLWVENDSTGRFTAQATPVTTTKGFQVPILIRDDWATTRGER